MLLSIEGDEAVGKTTLAYSAPLPIVGFQFDMGADRAIYGGRFNELFQGLDIAMVPYEPQAEVEPVWQTHDITVFEVPPPIQLGSVRVKGYNRLWTYFVVRCAEALSDPAVKTVVIDTMTVARRVKADAYLESLQDASFDAKGEPILAKPLRERLIQIEYGNPNDAIRDIYSTAAGLKKNLGVVHHLTDERAELNVKGEIKQVLTGKRILEGLNHTYRFVDVAMRLTKVSGPTIVGEFLKCGYDLAQEGTSMNNPTWDAIVNLIWMSSGERIKLDRRNSREVL